MFHTHRFLLIPALLLCACASIARTVGYKRQGSFPVPDLTNKTVAEAKDALATAGIVGSIDVRDNEVCPDLPVQVAHVCFTAPRAGAMTMSDLPVTIYLRAKETAFYVMPDISGMTADEAKQKLIGLGQDPHVILVETISGAPDDGCTAGHVCKQSPPAGDRTPADMQKYVGLGPAGAIAKQSPPPSPTATAPKKPEPTKPDPAKPAKKPDDAPAPLF